LGYAQLDEILARYDTLSMGGEQFFSVKRGTAEAPTLAVCFGPKRWALLRRESGGDLDVVSHTEPLPIGDKVPPPTMPGFVDDGRGAWTAEVARAHAARLDTDARYLGPLAFEHGEGLDFPALTRRQPPTPKDAAELPAALDPRPF